VKSTALDGVFGSAYVAGCCRIHHRDVRFDCVAKAEVEDNVGFEHLGGIQSSDSRVLFRRAPLFAGHCDESVL